MRKMNCIARLLERRRSVRSRGERGSAMVEFALVLPVVLLLTTGVFSFGIALNQYLELTNAVTIGGQLLAVSRGSTSNPCQTAVDAIYNAAPYLAEGKLNVSYTFTGPGGSSGTIANGSSQCSSTGTTGASYYMQQGESVQIIANYPCAITVYGGSFGCNLNAEITEVIQ
jgi:Flp pilus assembly protein TadG